MLKWLEEMEPEQVKWGRLLDLEALSLIFASDAGTDWDLSLYMSPSAWCISPFFFLVVFFSSSSFLLLFKEGPGWRHFLHLQVNVWLLLFVLLMLLLFLLLLQLLLLLFWFLLKRFFLLLFCRSWGGGVFFFSRISCWENDASCSYQDMHLTCASRPHTTSSRAGGPLAPPASFSPGTSVCWGCLQSSCMSLLLGAQNH